MLTRRRLLTSAALGGIAAGLGARAALAFSIEPMSKPVQAVFALACKPAMASGGDHGALIAAVQSSLKGKIAEGAAPANVQQVVVCPICGCRIIVTADASY
jgi:hypothetical protein